MWFHSESSRVSDFGCKGSPFLSPRDGFDFCSVGRLKIGEWPDESSQNHWGTGKGELAGFRRLNLLYFLGVNSGGN